MATERDLSQEFFVCWTCRELKCKLEFPLNPHGKRGIHPNCNACVELKGDSISKPGRPQGSINKVAETQKCRVCNERKSRTEFYRAPENVSGVQTTCIPCRKKQIREYRKKREARMAEYRQSLGLPPRVTHTPRERLPREEVVFTPSAQQKPQAQTNEPISFVDVLNSLGRRPPIMTRDTEDE
jgi:hypothetical protein